MERRAEMEPPFAVERMKVVPPPSHTDLASIKSKATGTVRKPVLTTGSTTDTATVATTGMKIIKRTHITTITRTASSNMKDPFPLPVPF